MARKADLALGQMEGLRPCMADRFVLTFINNRQVKAADFQYMESGAVLLTDSGRERKKRRWPTLIWRKSSLGE